MKTHDIVINHNDIKEAWFADPFVAHLFTYLMVIAAHCGFRFDGIDVETGTVLTSLKTVAAETGMSPARVRRCLERLAEMGEVTVGRHKNLTLVKVSRIAEACRQWEASLQSQNQPQPSQPSQASAPATETAAAEEKTRYSKSVYADGYEAAAKDPVTLARSECGIPCYFTHIPDQPRLNRQQRRRAAVVSQSTGSNSSLPTPHTGHTQSSGISSNGVPGAMPPSGSPVAGSYTHSHTVQTYFWLFLSIILNFEGY